MGTALPNTAKEILIRKFNAIKGAAIRSPKQKHDTSLTNSTVGLAVKKNEPMGRSSKLTRKALEYIVMDTVTKKNKKTKIIQKCGNCRIVEPSKWINTTTCHQIQFHKK